MKSNPQLGKAILEVVENQLKSNDPVETRQTFNRLVGEGYSEKEAKELIGQVVANEIFSVMSSKEPFNQKRFVDALNRLPTLPED